MNNFANTQRGHHFFDVHIPKIAKSLDSIANSLANMDSQKKGFQMVYIGYSEQHNVGDDTITDMQCFREIQDATIWAHEILEELELLNFFNPDKNRISEFFTNINNNKDSEINCYFEGNADVENPKYFSVTVKGFAI